MRVFFLRMVGADFAAYRMRRRWPGLILAEVLMLLSLQIWWTVTPLRAAIRLSESPLRTVTVDDLAVRVDADDEDGEYPFLGAGLSAKNCFAYWEFAAGSKFRGLVYVFLSNVYVSV